MLCPTWLWSVIDPPSCSISCLPRLKPNPVFQVLRVYSGSNTWSRSLAGSHSPCPGRICGTGTSQRPHVKSKGSDSIDFLFCRTSGRGCTASQVRATFMVQGTRLREITVQKIRTPNSGNMRKRTRVSCYLGVVLVHSNVLSCIAWKHPSVVVYTGEAYGNRESRGT